jgi:hypothetical protein
LSIKFQHDWLARRALLSAFHLSAFFLHSFTPLIQKNSWLLQLLQDQERGFLPQPPFGVWHHAGPVMSLVSLSKFVLTVYSESSDLYGMGPFATAHHCQTLSLSRNGKSSAMDDTRGTKPISCLSK